MQDEVSTILVVDDEEPILDFVEIGLAMENFRVVRALSGQQALQIFRENRPDAVILDLMLPDLDGLEVCRNIRSVCDIPILILTARGELEDRIQGLDTGADDYLSKPFRIRELQARLRALLRRSGKSTGNTLTFGNLLAQAFDQAAARLQSSFESQSRFVADASHELKTPLTILGGMAEVLEMGSRQDDPERQRAVSMIGQQVERMSRLVSDLLLLSKPAEGADWEPVELAGLLEDLVDGASMLGGHAHQFELHCSTEARVAGPETRVERIFRNLLDNAVQHGRPAGRVTVSVEVREGQVQATIADDGPGIAAEDLPHICDRFYRPDRSRQRGTGGTGLGLAIVQSLVESMNGRLSIQSQLERGTSITVYLPNQYAHTP